MNGLKQSGFDRIQTRRHKTLLLAVVCLGFCAAMSSTVSFADDPDQTPGPAARAVRLSNVEGEVQLALGNKVLASNAVANTPLFEGTRITTGDEGRAEIQFEDGSVARISPNSALSLTTLRGSGVSAVAEMTLEGGLGYFELQGGGQAGAISVKFADSEATASGFTILRINLDTPPGALAVFSGNAHVERGAAMSVELHGGESVTLSPDDISRYTLNETIEPDSWDAWNSDRDQVLSAEASATSSASKDAGQSGNPGWSDLDANGSWYNVPGQGNVWSPYTASSPGFDPYGNGNWMYNTAYGYSFISGYSWGYIPYQCGLWNWYDNFGWGWAPGMGGCNPWWGYGGVGYFAPNIGSGFRGYRPPLRPHPPRRPLGGGMIAVNRHQTAPVGSLPLRDKTSVVNIAGNTVMPLRPISPRLQYDHSNLPAGNRSVVSGGLSPASQVRGASGQVHSGSTPGRPAPAPARSSSASHASSAPASHASSGGGFSGGGGGGAAHASGGGSHH
jgi:hypothetical protein